MAGNPNWPKVVLAMHMDGPNNSTDFVDVKGHVFQRSGTPVISTVLGGFGGACARFDGNLDFIYTADSEDWNFGTGKVTFAARVYKEETGGVQTIASQAESLGAQLPSWAIYIDSANHLAIVATSGTSSWNIISLTTTNTVPMNAFAHIEVDIDYPNIYLFIDGELGAKGTLSQGMPNSASPLRIGNTGYTSTGHDYGGGIEEVIITKGAVEHTAAADPVGTQVFTPPTGPFLEWAGELTVSITETIAANDFSIRAYRLSDGALIADTVGVAGDTVLQTLTVDPVLITVMPVQGGIWTADTAKAVGDLVFPTDPVTTPYYYKANTAGTTGSNEPTFPGGSGQTVTDGGVEWECVDRMAQPVSNGPLIPQ